MRTLFIAVLLTPFVWTATAQQVPLVEAFGGYSFLRAGEAEGDNTLRESTNLHGWNGSIQGNVNPWLGIVLDVSGHYGSREVQWRVPGAPQRLEPDVRSHSILAGPRFTYRANDYLTPFAHALFGVTLKELDRKAVPVGTVQLHLNEMENPFAMAFGGGLDVRATDWLALRLIQADYLFTTGEDDTTHNARLGAGLVLRFGQR